MADVDEVAENIYLIDDLLYSIPGLGSVYLLNEERKALVETGPASSAKAVLDGIKRVGVRPEDIAYIIVTHVHLDHAGGAGVLLKSMPQAKVVVHHKGVRHMANPAKLVAGMIQALGEETMAACGEVVPIDWHRLQAVYDDDSIRLSDRQVLKFIDAPGHATHQFCVYESRNNGIFTGDAAGEQVGEIVLPFQSPPSFDLRLCIDTISKLMKLKANIIYFSHFGVSNKVQENLQMAVDNLQAWGDIVAEAVKKNTADAAAERISADVCVELEPVRKMKSLYEHYINTWVPSSVAAHVKYQQENLG